MPQSDVYEVIELLPWALQRETARYVASVRANADELFRQAQIPLTPERLEQLLFLAAIQKLWATVNAQAWIADSTLGLIQEPSDSGERLVAAGLRLGRATYSRDSEQYIGLRSLRTDLDQTLRKLEIRDLIRRSSLVELIRILAEREPDGR